MNETAHSKAQAENPNSNGLPSERQNQIATVLIGILVIIAGFLTYNYLQTRQSGKVETGDQNLGTINQVTPRPEKTSKGKGVYVVESGDTLSSIAERIYGNPQNWHEIAQANNISLDHPMIQTGQELNLPAIGGPAENSNQKTLEPTVEPTTKPTTTIGDKTENLASKVKSGTITETPATAVQTYKVVHGDTLWGIAKSFYGNGAAWHKIYEANSLSMYQVNDQTFPLIHAGNVLVIPD